MPFSQECRKRYSTTPVPCLLAATSTLTRELSGRFHDPITDSSATVRSALHGPHHIFRMYHGHNHHHRQHHRVTIVIVITNIITTIISTVIVVIIVTIVLLPIPIIIMITIIIIITTSSVSSSSLIIRHSRHYHYFRHVYFVANVGLPSDTCAGSTSFQYVTTSRVIYFRWHSTSCQS